MAAEQLTQIGIGEQQHRVVRMGCDCPGRAIECAGQGKLSPGCSVIFAAPKFAGIAWWAIAVGQENHGIIVATRYDATCVLPRRIQCLKHPGFAVVGAAMQATIGRGIDDFLILFVVHDGDAVHIA